MESSTAVPEKPITTEDQPPEEAAEQVFTYSRWVHVGTGAQACPHAEDGGCSDVAHFHAWVRLPNKIQVTNIREKAQAARARVIRQAKDPESDRSAIIDNQLAETKAAGVEAMIEELTARNSNRWHQQAMAELAEDDDDDEGSRFAHIEEDQRRFSELAGMEPEQRPQDEYDELIKHLESWNDEVEAKVAELSEPELSSLRDRSTEELEEMLREQVVSEQASQIFMRVFSVWQYTVCTQRPNKNGHMAPVYSTAADLEAVAPEVFDALEESFKVLENKMAERAALRAEGN